MNKNSGSIIFLDSCHSACPCKFIPPSIAQSSKHHIIKHFLVYLVCKYEEGFVQKKSYGVVVVDVCCNAGPSAVQLKSSRVGSAMLFIFYHIPVEVELLQHCYRIAEY